MLTDRVAVSCQPQQTRIAFAAAPLKTKRASSPALFLKRKLLPTVVAMRVGSWATRSGNMAKAPHFHARVHSTIRAHLQNQAAMWVSPWVLGQARGQWKFVKSNWLQLYAVDTPGKGDGFIQREVIDAACGKQANSWCFNPSDNTPYFN